MHDNRNKEVIKRVEKGMMKANRTRNIFAIVAVALTTFMITTIFSLGINYKENMELTSVRTSGTNANVSLAMPTNEQEKEIRDLDYVKTVGTQYMIGSVAEKNEADRDLAIAMQYYDNTEWEKHYKEAISNIKGEYPKKENEIMLSEDALSQLGIKEPKLDMEIPLSYISKDGEQKDTFTLSGWFRSYTGTGMAFLSESYCQEHGYTMQNSGVLSISLDNPKDNFYDIQDDIALNENQTFQGSVSMSSSSGSVYAMIILLVFFIIGSGYLLIYNVLYISISRDTRFYGLIKTLGTTEKQIKTLVKRQALTFGCIGIPIGVILAGVLSFGIVPVILENAFDSGKSIMDAEMFFHPSIFILSIIFSALTVWISCNAPAKVAGKISPIEALRYQNFASTKTKSRNSTNGGKLHVMAYHNVFRDKKRAFLVFISLFMGITMILGVNGVLGSFKAENYVEKYMDYDFEYTDMQFRQYEQPNKEIPQFDEQFVEEINQIGGVENVDVQKAVWAGIDFDEAVLEDFMEIKYEDSRYKSDGQSYQEMVADLKKYANAGDYGCYITTLDDKVIEEYNAKHPDTPIDIEKFQRGETAISGMDTEYNAPNTALVGKTLSLTADSSDGKATDFLIDGSFYFEDYENNLSEGIGHRKAISIVPDIIYVSEAGIERLTKTPIISGIGIDIKDMNQVEQIDSELQALNGTLTKQEWSYKSPIGMMEEYNQVTYSMNLMGNGAAVLLIVIGLINFINVMLTGVVARKNEFAVMESIGTSKKQIQKILTLEGGIYALITTGLIMTLGNAFLLLVADAVPHMADYAKFEYPFALVICLIFAIFIICLSVPAIVYRAVSKETVIERLHDLGN
ncbi:TPA: ABC transporter permease [Clostridioides difficile]|nr:ABC transporter permease [Clostridioides difficile]